MVAFKNSTGIKANSSFCTFRFPIAEAHQPTKPFQYQAITTALPTQPFAHFVFMPIVIFFASIILGGFYASEHKEIFSVVGAIIGIGFILFLLFAVWSFVSESTTSKWKSALRTIGITILIIGVLLLIGYLMPDSCSNYVNDAHRPDRF